MKMEPIVSSNLAATGHEGDVMHIQFKHGGTFAYQPVTAEKHADLRAAKSPGSHLCKMGVKGVKLPEERKACTCRTRL